jgi:hypothetical protein
MQVKFDLGRVMIEPDAALVLDAAGQEADFFLYKHGIGDCGEEDPSANDFRQLVKSRYRTLKGQIIEVLTFVRKQETYVYTLPNTITSDGNVYRYDADGAVPETPAATSTTVESPSDLHTLPTSIDFNAHVWDGCTVGSSYDADGAGCATSTDKTTTLESPPDQPTSPKSIGINGYGYDADGAVPETPAATSTTIESPSDTDVQMND